MIIRRKRDPFTGKYKFKVVSVDSLTDVENTVDVFNTEREAREFMNAQGASAGQRINVSHETTTQ